MQSLTDTGLFLGPTPTPIFGGLNADIYDIHTHAEQVVKHTFSRSDPSNVVIGENCRL